MGGRQILFRGKRLDNGEWVYGVPFFVVSEDDREEKTYACISKGVDWDGTCGFMSPSNDAFIAVIPETVGQFTGASENGKKLFERDRVLVDDDITGVVLYDSGAFIIASNDVSDGYVLLSDYVDSEGEFYGQILGNVHEGEQG